MVRTINLTRWLEGSPLFGAVAGIIVVALVFFWGLRVRDIQRMKKEIAQIEAKIARGQELWRRFPPLSGEEKRRMQRVEQRLIRLLPEDKDLPALFEEISGVAQRHHLVGLKFNVGNNKAPVKKASVVAVTGAPPRADSSKGQDGIGSYALKLAFSGDFREVAYFLEDLQHLSRLVRVQSVRIRRKVPFQGVEIALNAYYQRGDLSALVR